MELERQLDCLEQFMAEVRHGREGGREGVGETRCVLLYTTPILRIYCGFDVLLVVWFISGQTLKLSMHFVGRQEQQ